MVGYRYDREQTDTKSITCSDDVFSSTIHAHRWYCVYTQPGKETFAAENLKQQSYECFLPAIAKTVRHARKTRRVRAALFPRYLFVHADISVQTWRPIRSTYGVIDLILQNDRPKPVPHGVVESLLTALSDDGHIDFRSEIEVGQDVRMMSGPFFNLVGRLEHIDERGRVKVLLDILGAERTVVADRAALQPVAA